MPKALPQVTQHPLIGTPAISLRFAEPPSDEGTGAGTWVRKRRALSPWCSPPAWRCPVSHRAISAVTEGSSTQARLLLPCLPPPIHSSLSIPM